MPKIITAKPDTYFRKLTAPGSYAAGDVAGLFLKISKTGARSWVTRLTVDGVRKDIGCGSYPTTTLAEARTRARELHTQVARGIDPVAAKAERMAAAKPRARRVTFREAIDATYRQKRKEWTSAQHSKNWLDSFERYVPAAIFAKAVEDVGIEDVKAILRPLWDTKAPTGVALRPRIEAVLAFAEVQGWRPKGWNPATWTGNLEHILPKPKVAANTKHFAALPYERAPEVYTALRANPAGSATRLALLTAARPAEIRGLVWEELDLAAALWVLPKERTKNRLGHRVPLSTEAVAILEQVQAETGRTSGLVFLGVISGRRLSDLAIRQPLRAAAGDPTITLHGTARSTFRDWCGLTRRHDSDLAELQLQHRAGRDSTVAAYYRTDHLEERRVLLQAWADYLTSLVYTASDKPMKTTVSEAA